MHKWLIGLLGAVLCLSGQDVERVSGLSLRVAGPKGSADVRSVQRPAFVVEAGKPPTPFVEAGPFKARWEGFLHLESRSRVYFSFGGRGKARLEIGGETVLAAEGEDLSETETERLRLNSGEHLFVLEYESPPKGAAAVRLYWRGRDFTRETLPQSVFRREPGKFLGDALREGRALFAESACIRCHGVPNLSLVDAMPELAQRAPLFVGIGARLNEDWMAHWVANPKHLRPSAKMPSMLGLESPAAAIAAKDSRPWDIAAFLSNQSGDAPVPLGDPSKAGVGEGRGLFHALGCIGCHKAEEEPVGTEKFGRIDLADIGSKFKDGALRDFLRQPGKHYPWVRMPDFNLSNEEASILAMFLRSLEKKPAPKGLPGDASKGEKLVLSLGCLNCHKGPVQDYFQAPALAAIAKAGPESCLAEDVGAAPDYQFTAAQRTSLVTFLQEGADSLQRHSPAEFAERQVEALNCNACHSMQGVQNQLSLLPELATHLIVDVADTEAEVEAAGRKKDPPDLTHIGEKLRADWMAKLFAGRLDYKPRPWMQMRMPAFPARGGNIAAGLAALHGMTVQSDSLAFDKSWIVTGQKLVSPNGGFACVACHAVGEKPALAPFEGQGLNFMYSRERLNHEFYLRWMFNPQRINPLSIMPRYADDEGRTALGDTLEGKGADQFNAIWQYLRHGQF